MATSKVRKDNDGKPVKYSGKSVYTFVYDGKKYDMPINTEASSLVANDVWMDAFLDSDDEVKNMKLVYDAYKADPNISDDVRGVLNKMPADQFITHLLEWFSAEDQSGVSQGESSSSDEI